MVLCGGFWGTAADMLGRRCTLIIAGSLSGIFEFLSAFTVNYWQMFLCKFLAGCTYDIMRLLKKKILKDIYRCYLIDHKLFGINKKHL